MKDYKKNYYEQSAFWESDHFSTPAEADRISETIKTIPADTLSILDVGCGNGVFINTLFMDFSDKFERIVGLDTSSQALKYVKTEKMNGSIDNIPYESESFDMVSCLELLEHLPQQEFAKGISEIQRVSRKYILVSVPNDEVLEQFLVHCPKCCCAFNPYFHMRSFSKDTLKNLFADFEPIIIREIGPKSLSYSYRRFMFYLRLCYGNPSPPALSICPQCGYQNKNMLLDKKNIQNKCALNFEKLLPFIKLFIQRREKRRWLLALYVRLAKFEDPN